MRWDLRGTPQQNAIIQQALDRCDFPFEDFGTAVVPVEWADLSAYGMDTAAAKEDTPLVAEVRHGEADHDHDHDHEHSGEFDTLEFRNRVLGLAWYSGRVTIEVTLVNDPELAMEVFLSEGAHMVDFRNIGGMTDDQRIAIWNSLHTEDQHIAPGTRIEDGVDLGHGHGWFDVGRYRAWVGEAWMGLFTRSFSDVPVTIPFDHPVTDTAVAEMRRVFLGEGEPTEPEPEAPTEPTTPETTPEAVPYFGIYGSSVYHDSHRNIRQDVTYTSKEDAEAGGRRPCGVCKP